jgi:hypothetical protein
MYSVSLGPFDGRVAAIHSDPSCPAFYIASPNQDDVFAPPGPCNVYARADGRYGPDDHTQWPQPFSHSAPYLCCIPKRDGQQAENSIMWWNPTSQDFKSTVRHEWDLGIGFLPQDELQLMVQSCERLNKRVEKHSANNNHHPAICPLSTNLRRTLNRLRAVAMTRREVLFECRQVQRQWMELRALMDYIEIYEPHMEGPPAKEVANVIGCFVRDPHVAERLFSAGIPYWFIRPVASFSNENILSIVTMVQPKDALELDDHIKPFPRIYAGDSNYNRFRAISEHGMKSLRYTDFFRDGNHQGVKPLEFVENSGSARSSRNRQNTHQRFQPCKIPFFKLLHVVLYVARSPASQAHRTQRISGQV